MKELTKEEYYQVLGLYITARQMQSRVDSMQGEIQAILGIDEGFVDEAIYSYENIGTMKELDVALKKEGVSIPDLTNKE